MMKQLVKAGLIVKAPPPVEYTIRTLLYWLNEPRLKNAPYYQRFFRNRAGAQYDLLMTSRNVILTGLDELGPVVLHNRIQRPGARKNHVSAPFGLSSMRFF